MDQDKDDRMLGLSPAQVAGSALAAVSGALLASFAGTTGTIIGTAVGSVVATVGGAIYTWSLKRSSAAVLRTAAQVRQTALLTGPLPRTVAQGPMRSAEDPAPEGGQEGAPAGAPDGTAKGASEGAADDAAAADAEEERPRRAVPWGKALLASLAVTGAVLGGITVFEAITGKPISSLIGRGDSEGTSVGNLVRDDRSPSDDKPTDKATPTEGTQAPEPDPEPTPSPEVPLPSVTPTAEPTAPPSAEPSAVPQDGSEGAPGTGTDPDPAP